MHIIFGDAIKHIPDSFTVLELDTVCKPPDMTATKVWCLVENLPLNELPVSAHLKKLHQDVITFYKQRHWDFCVQAINENLLGKWHGELDSFYLNLLQRIAEYKINPPPDGWDGTLSANQPLN